MAAKGSNPDADTEALEQQIDKEVFAAYDLNANDIQIVESALQSLNDVAPTDADIRKDTKVAIEA